jgi:DNA-binding CsgD family transcriptional regulator
VLRRLAGAIGADTVGLGLGLPGPDPESEGQVIEVDADPRLPEAMLHAFQLRDAAATAFLTSAVGASHTFSRLLGQPRYVRTGFYNEVLRAHGYGEGLFVTTARQAGQQSGLGCFRAHDRPDFGDEEMRLVETLVPHLQLALRIHARLARAADDRRAAWQAVDGLAVGVVAVDARGRILQSNAAAERMLRARDGIGRDRGGILRASRPDGERELARALRAAGGRRDASRGALALPRPSGLRPLQILIASMPGPVGGAWSGAETAAVVLVSDPERTPELPEDRVRRLFRLTRAEARVAVQLTLGASPREIAEASGVRVNSVRFHLKQIYAKTGTRRQAELVSLLLRSPALLVR